MIDNNNLELRSITNKVGLNNLGCTCYMNSLMQQLFNNERLRNNILSLDLQNEKEKNLLVQTQLLFSHLLNYEFKSIKPSNFVISFDPNINIFEQKDVDEFFNELCEKYENTIKLNKLKNPFNDEFEGSYANELIGKTCPHRSEREESFKCIILSVKNSIEESLQFLVNEEILDGDNAFYCDECQSKVSAIKRLSIKKPPKTLILVLKRFEYDYGTEMKFKLNSYCKFGSELDLQPFLQENFSKMSCSNLNDEIKNEKSMFDLKGIIMHAGTSENGHYYSLIKQSDQKNENVQNNKSNIFDWLEFNDSIVKPFNFDKIEETFGGIEYITNKEGNTEEIQKSTNAYVLFYERRDLIKQNDSYFNDSSISKKNQKGNIISDKINQENFNSWVSKTLMSKIFHDFIINFSIKCNFQNLLDGMTINDNIHQFYTNNKAILLNYNVSSLLGKESSKNLNDKLFKYPLNRKERTSSLSEYLNSNIEELSNYQTSNLNDNVKKESFKILCITFFNCIVRYKEKSNIPLYVDLIKTLINYNIENALFLINELNEISIKEYLIENPIQDMKRIICGIIHCSIIKIFKNISEELIIYGNNDKRKEFDFEFLDPENLYNNILFKFVNILIISIKNNKSSDLTYVYSILSKIVQLGNESSYLEIILYMKSYFLECGFFEYILINLLNENESKILFREENEEELRKLEKVNNKEDTPKSSSFSKSGFNIKSLFPFEESQENKIRDKLSNLKNQSYKLIILIEMIYHSTIPLKASNEISEKDNFTYIDYKTQTLKLVKKDIIQLITFNTTLYQKILENIKNKSASVIWCKYVLVSSYNNMEYTKKFIGIIFDFLEKNDADDIEFCLSFLKNLLLLEDSLSKQRRTEIILNLFKCFEKNKKYYKFSETLIDFTTKLFTSRKNLYSEIESFSKLLKTIYDWIKENPIPPMYQNSNYLFMFKFKTHKIPSSLNQQIIGNFNSKYQKISSEKLSMISNILKSKFC